MIHRFKLVAVRTVGATLLCAPIVARAEPSWVPIQKQARSPIMDPSVFVGAHFGAAGLGGFPDTAVTLGGGLRWPLTDVWGLGASLDFGYSFGKAFLGAQEYDTLFGIARIAALAFLDERGFYRLEATLGAGPARFSVMVDEASASETVVSYVIGAGFGISWFHIEAEYFGHRAEPCEPPSDGLVVCYRTELGGAVLAGLQIPFSI